MNVESETSTIWWAPSLCSLQIAKNECGLRGPSHLVSAVLPEALEVSASFVEWVSPALNLRLQHVPPGTRNMLLRVALAATGVCQ